MLQSRLELLQLPEIAAKNCQAAVLRLDRIHPVVSGNKWFKLKYFLEEAAREGSTSLLTFGGAWSNHIIATAFAARDHGFGSIGIIRGEMPRGLSATLVEARACGMELVFTSRRDFDQAKLQTAQDPWKAAYPGSYIIPEGGAGSAGVRGASEILRFAGSEKFTHIMCCIGTGTTFAGLATGLKGNQRLVGIPVLKGMSNIPATLTACIPRSRPALNDIIPTYHFGGYAKKTPLLLQSMNDFYRRTGIPTDFVYTGKLIFAFFDLLTQNYYPPDSNILIVHSGGLQGNASLQKGELIF